MSASLDLGRNEMILLDDRVGSRELMRFFTPQQAKLSRLQFGDAMFLGNGPEGVPLMIGVERKALADMLCSMVDGRFAGHQLPGLLRDYHRVYLVVEGRYRPDPQTGVLQVPGKSGWRSAEFGAKRWMYRDLDGFLTTMENRYNVHVRRTYDQNETARCISNLHHWWTDKTFDEHRSGCAFDYSGEPPLLPTSLLRRMAAQLKGVGWKRAQAVEQHYTSVVDMILAPVEEWRKITGIGKGIAAGVVEEIWKQKRS
jgi:ERCC4-type nuclease